MNNKLWIERRKYNCGGYALGTKTWYLPFERSTFDEGVFFRGGVSNYLDYFVNYMLEDFAGKLRVIESIKDLQDDEYAIAFRTGDLDFHYVKRGKNGNWYSKLGSTAEIQRIRKEDVFSDYWNFSFFSPYYDSPIVLLAMKEEVRI